MPKREIVAPIAHQCGRRQPTRAVRSILAWLRWQLAGDTTMKQQFVGPDCTLCKRPDWMVMQKDFM